MAEGRVGCLLGLHHGCDGEHAGMQVGDCHPFDMTVKEDRKHGRRECHRGQDGDRACDSQPAPQ